ncbi:unnamed protein product [Adineta ricciae]|uniref:Uncharacterized protein n=1 Tax=Adineta ricciae TaxID=249248 RepID=A0A813W9C1_ADIRI|nr:unnamed protein product [Adineta ricciae]CAF1571855.1 unnamed protein product [Adineta ricciae]
MDLETVSYSDYVRHRYRYHQIRLAHYEKMKNEQKRTTEEQLLRKYEILHNQYCVEETIDESNQISNDRNNFDSNLSWSDVFNLVATLEQSQDTTTISRIHKSLEIIFQEQVRTLDQYLILKNYGEEIQSLLETLKMNGFDELLNEENNEKNNYLELLSDVISFVSSGLTDRQVYFANILLSNLPQLENMLFHDIPRTELCITQRYRQWALLFHSDRHRANPIFDELMKHINSCRDRYLSEISSFIDKASVIQNDLEKGHNHAALAQDYKKRFKSGRDGELNIDQLKRLFSFEALVAFEHYRAALKSLGKISFKEDDIIQRAQILEWMGLMMRLSGQHDVEAQLYIVAAIYIITQANMTERLFQKLRQLQGALEKYQGLTKTTAEENNATVSANAHREIVLCTDPQLSSREILDESQIFIRQTILRKCVLRSAQLTEFSDESRYVEGSDFLTSANRAMQVAGMATQLAVGVSIPIIVKAASWLYNKFVFSSKTKRLLTENLSHEYEIRDNLNKMMDQAIKHYNNEEYDKFIDFLCKPYYEERRLMDKRSGSETISIEIRVDQIIEPLLKHGFRADKIAYLLILIGEVLLRGVDFHDPRRTNPEHTALLEQSKILFQGTYDSPRLFEAAEKFDKHIESYHHQKLGRLVSKIVNPISEKDIADARETLVTNRLRGYYRLARLNYAIACLLAGGKENYERCKESLKKLNASENAMCDRFFYIPDERIQALEDLLSAFGMDNDSSNSTNLTNIHAIDHNESFDLINIEYLKNHLGYNACQKIIKMNDEDDQLVLLTQLMPNKHGLNHENLIAHMLNKYRNDNELILAFLRQEHVSNLSEWANQSDSTKHIFRHQAYLPILSSFANLKIYPCNVIPDAKYGVVFTTSHAVIDYTSGETEVYDLYVVVLPGHDRISHVFTVVPVEINHLHWQMEDLPRNHPWRAEVLLRIAKHYEDEARQDDKRNHLAGIVMCCLSRLMYICRAEV